MNWITEHKAHELHELYCSKQLRDRPLPRPHRGYSDEMRRRIMMEMVMAGGGSPFSPASLPSLLLGGIQSPFVAAFQGGAGTFGSQYAAPSTTPAGTANGIAFSPDGNWVAMAVAASPFIEVYAWSKASGFGAKVSDPVTLPAGAAQDVAWSPDGAYVGVAHTTTPFVSVYPFSGGALGAKVSNPGTLPAANALGIAWSPDGAYVGIGHNTTPFVSVYPWSAGFGSKVANPSSLPTVSMGKLRWSPSGAYLLGKNSSSAIGVYAWSAGFGSQFTQNLGTSSCWGWSSDGNYVLAVNLNVAQAYPFSGAGFGALASSVSLGNTARSIAQDAAGKYVAIGINNQPYILVYNWTPGNFGSKLADPSPALPLGFAGGTSQVAFGS